jgi:hypothetical protein
MGGWETPTNSIQHSRKTYNNHNNELENWPGQYLTSPKAKKGLLDRRFLKHSRDYLFRESFPTTTKELGCHNKKYCIEMNPTEVVGK